MLNKVKHFFFTTCLFGTVLVFVMYTYKIYIQDLEVVKIDKVPWMIYVLQRTSPKTEPFVYMLKGQDKFIKQNCSKQNCYITSKKIFSHITDFDVVLFHAPEIVYADSKKILPRRRSIYQHYIFVSMESSANYPIRDHRYNGVFNLTWTYKLSSDIYYGYMIIRNHDGEVIGPRVDIPWISVENMLPIKENIKAKLENKKIAAAWFVSNCHAINNRSGLANEVIKELKKHNMTVDVYGGCGTKKCLKSECLLQLQRDYYFYFAFENSMSSDYVTEKLLRALQNYVVPVVFGGADYKRFMPDGIYINANELTVEELVKQMVGIINDKNRYHNFFKWHNHYSYHNPGESIDTDVYCKFCDYLNKLEFRKRRSSAIINFKKWWNP